MIEAQASSVISAAGLVVCRVWAYADTGSGSYGRLAGMKGETAEGFFSQPGEKFWADAEYAADCHCCGALSKV